MDSINEFSTAKLEKIGNFMSNISSIIYGKKDDNPDNYLSGSISQYSKNLVMTFPVLCDNTLSPETASMISKANERNITTMLQLLFTAMNIEANDGMKVISKIHKNISTGMDVAEVADKMEQIGTRATVYGVAKKDIFARESAQAVTEMMSELKSKKYNVCFPVDSLNEDSLNRFSITKTYRGIVVKEAITPDQHKIVDTVYRIIRAEDQYPKGWAGYPNAAEKYYEYINSPEFAEKINNLITTASIDVPVTDKQRAEIEAEVRKTFEDDLELQLKNAQLQHYNSQIANQKMQAQHYNSQIASNKLKNFEIMRNATPRLIDQEVKKSNELQPTVIQVNYSQKNEAGEFELRSFLAGIKSRLIPVSSTDIVERLIAKNKTKINFLNFIRATTGEIKFFKDFLFAIDQAKLDSKNAVKKGEAAAIWNCLSNRAVKNTNSKLKKLGNDASAITMLVISQETVNYMKNVHKFDLEKMNNTKMICDSYNLMGIIIADESVEVIKSYYVGNNNYEQIAYSFLEKEAKNSDYKKMINLFGKMNVR